MASSDDLLELARIFYDYTKSPRVEKLITRLESQGEAKAVGCRIAEACGLHDGHDGECVAYWAVGAPPPTADEVSNETLRMFAATVAPDNESLRVTARAALAARADLATARRERDEARAEVERLQEAARLVVHNAFRIDNNDGYMKIGARWIAALRAALTPTQEPKP